MKKIDETSLPPKESFYSKLTRESITDEDYQHADVFENFRNICMNHYGLDPAWYFSAPGLAWDAALKITKIELKLLSDLDMLLMIESSIRGEIAIISHRHATANNEYMGADFDVDKETKFISYLDANNLYGWAMSKQLSTSGFEWMIDDELDDWKHLNCILEVDLEYAEDGHNLRNDYSRTPERVTIVNVEKLIPNLNNKTNYVVHYENLKSYESLGL